LLIIDLLVTPAGFEPATLRLGICCAAFLLAHLSQFVLHAVENAAQIDRIHAIEFFDAGISGSGQDRLSTLRARRGWDKEKPDLGIGRAD
jgi:hypothetical protein